MPKKYPRKRKFNLRKVRVEAGLAIGALAASDVVSSALTAVSANRYRVTSIKASYTITDLAAVIDDAFQFGIAHSDYTAAEIEECIEATAAIDIGDKIAQERANRLVREIGTIGSAGLDSALGGVTYNEGRPVKTKLNWLIGIGDTLVLYVRNGSGTVYSTGSTLKAKGELWVTP